jgi:hypothetical protein
MYRRSKFLEILIDIRQEMAREADYDTELYAEMARSGRSAGERTKHRLTENGETRSVKAGGGRQAD